jgi:predicted SprT family Zn-dependent metalloprotease
MADEITLDDLVVRCDDTEELKRGLTMGFDADGKSFVWVCQRCGEFKNIFKAHPSGRFYYCVKCQGVVALRAVGHPGTWQT